MENKTCNQCKVQMPISCFNKQKSVCKECTAKWRQANKDKLKERQAKWKKSHPDKYKETYIKYNRIRKIKVLEKVANGSNLKCRRCGCDFIDLLEINHINGGGGKECNKSYQKFCTAILNGSRSINDLEILCKLCNNLHYLEMKFGKTQYELYWDKNDKNYIERRLPHTPPQEQPGSS